ncbi:entericidin EcnA/B family protein [Primorskyibacter flagellatus]
MTRTKITATLALLSLAALTACATVDGVGQDISTGARNVQSWF